MWTCKSNDKRWLLTQTYLPSFIILSIELWHKHHPHHLPHTMILKGEGLTVIHTPAAMITAIPTPSARLTESPRKAT